MNAGVEVAEPRQAGGASGGREGSATGMRANIRENGPVAVRAGGQESHPTGGPVRVLESAEHEGSGEHRGSGYISRADKFVCRLLCVRGEHRPPAGGLEPGNGAPQAGDGRWEAIGAGGQPIDRAWQGAAEERAHRIFGVSMALSALRCLLSYVVLPVVLPTAGLASGVGPAIGIPVGLLALVFDVMGIRRFWQVNHPWRWPVGTVYVAVMVMVVSLVVVDAVSLVR